MNGYSIAKEEELEHNALNVRNLTCKLKRKRETSSSKYKKFLKRNNSNGSLRVNYQHILANKSFNNYLANSSSDSDSDEANKIRSSIIYIRDKSAESNHIKTARIAGGLTTSKTEKKFLTYFDLLNNSKD